MNGLPWPLSKFDPLPRYSTHSQQVSYHSKYHTQCLLTCSFFCLPVWTIASRGQRSLCLVHPSRGPGI